MRFSNWYCGLALAFAAWMAGSPAASAAETVTFNRHIAPILWKNCAGCHRDGEVGPFPLLSYQDAAPRADLIREATANRRMPPWKAEPDFGHFADVRRLAEPDLELLKQWIDAGAKEGSPADLPPPPQFVSGWQLGDPDLVLRMPETFDIPADGRDIYRCFVIPIGNAEIKQVAAVEFRPGNRRVVHHAILYLDSSGAARRKDASDPGPGYDSFGGPGILASGGLGGWTPGQTPYFLADGLARHLPANSDLVLQVHYHPNGKPETDQSAVGIHFRDKPAERLVTGIPLLNFRINIPPDEPRYEAKASVTLPVDMSVLGVQPHMHLLGREMKLTAETPDGRSVPMVWIKEWDFNWQDHYRFVEPVRLPAGTRLQLTAYYDNTAGNPRNPNSPPRRVRWGEQTTDEMCVCAVQIYTDRAEDIRELYRMRGWRLGAALGGALPDPAVFAPDITPVEDDDDD